MNAPPRPHPWTEARARLPGYSLLRVIDLDAGTDTFEIVRARREDPELLDVVLDGWTIITPATPERRSDAELAAIIAVYDQRWRARAAAGVPDPDTPKRS